MDCQACYKAVLSNCSDQVTVTGGFTPLEDYKWLITDKFGNKYSKIVTANSSGAIIILASDLPPGFLNPAIGEFTLQFFDSNDVPFVVAICQLYDCVQVQIIKNTPDQVVTDIGNCPSSGSNASGKFITVSFIAQENIPAFSPVTSDGFIGDSSDVTQKGKIIGITTEDVASGDEGEAVLMGEVTNPAWVWTVGGKIFLAVNTIDDVGPGSGFFQQLGTVTAADTVVIFLDPPILM